MKLERFTLFLDRCQVMANIGIHDFERQQPQRLHISVSVDIEPARFPDHDGIEGTLDYDWIRTEIQRLTAENRYDLQETLCQAILNAMATRSEVIAATVETAKPDVYADARKVGCRLTARR